jgi:energy-coupling factor transporter ATP-binding protein EcfA2
LANIVVADNLRYAYPPAVAGEAPEVALRGVSLTIGEGEFVALMGPAGAGKTTFCLALNGIVPHFTGGTIGGRLLVDGADTLSRSVAELARVVGLVFQEPDTQLFNMTVEAEVAFGLESLAFDRCEMAERIAWALARVGLDGQRGRSPHHLSGGQKQRLAIAAVLAMRPRLFVLDEPTAHLDPAGKRELFAVLRELRGQGMTVLLVEQESEWIAEFADRVVVLVEGRIVLEGPPQEIFADPERLRELGLAAPQVSELAGCLNRRCGTAFAFTRLDEATAALQGWLVSP